MKDYHINILFSDEDDCYVADIPDLPFCSGLGDTPEQALAQAEEAKKPWLAEAAVSGRDVPLPSYRPLIYRPGWAQAVGEGKPRKYE